MDLTQAEVKDKAVPSANSPVAATPTTVGLQLETEVDAELYGSDSEDTSGRSAPQPALVSIAAAEKPVPSDIPPSPGGIPGLFLLSDPSNPGLEAEAMALDTSTEDIQSPIKNGNPVETRGFTAQDFKFAIKVDPPQEAELQPAEAPQPVEAPMVEPSAPKRGIVEDNGTPSKVEDDIEMADKTEVAPPDESIATEKATSPPKDPEFIATGEANKNDETAEWQLDSSDSDTSDDSSDDSDDSSDAGSDDYPMMDHAQLAKLLMREDGDDESSHKEGFQGPLKTRNEVAEEAVKIERPNVVVTPDMPVEILGAIETIVGTMVLIKAFVSGDHQVLNEGSLLVFDDRSILGVVADTFGRVEEPLYTVRFNTPEEIDATRAKVGAKVFYVPQHSDYVFTQALKGIKGSDASNIFDEEVGDAEREFSDDEAEAEYKRQRKHARQAQAGGNRGNRNDRGGSSRGGGGGGGGGAPQTPRGGGGEADELYTPLARPANLAELMSGPPPPLPPMNGGGGGGRGGDRGHRGGRNERGRGRGRGGQRGGRGRDRDRDRDGHEFRKRDRDDNQGRNYDRDASPSSYQQRPPQSQPQSYPQVPPQSYAQGGYQQQQQPQQPQHPQQYQQYQPQPQQQQWSPSLPQFPQFPQFPGYPPQQQPQSPYQYHPQQQQGFSPAPPVSQFPPTLPQGAHVNPAFFGRQQQQQQQHQQQQGVTAPPGRNDFNWTGPQQQQQQQSTEAAFKALQSLVSLGNQMRNPPGPPPPPPPQPPTQ